MALALDKTFEVIREALGQETKFPALHARWMKKMNFLQYLPPPVNMKDHAALEEWAERLDFIQEDLEELLQMKHDKFWCQVVFDEKLQKFLESYLRYAPRHYDTMFHFPERIQELHDQVHRSVFIVYLRMSTHKESKDDFITPSVFGEILYENFLLDAAKMMDLCVLYGGSGSKNVPLLTKMLNNVFTQQPKYNDDVRATIPTMLQVLDSISVKCGISIGSSPVRLGSSGGGPKTPLTTMPIAQFKDVVFYLNDTAHTLSAFLDACPNLAAIFAEFEFHQKLAITYEQLIAEFHKAFAERDWSAAPEESPILKQKLRQAQLCMLRTYRQIVNTLYLQPVLEAGDVDVASQCAEQYVDALSGILSERRFLAHYETLFPLADDLDLITQAGGNIDDTRISFLRDAINEAYSIYGKRQRKADTSPLASQPTPSQPSTTPSTQDGSNGMNDYASSEATSAGGQVQGAGARELHGVELESAITSVKDLLPDLGDGFIQSCLEEYDYSVENVINNVLEDRLPPHLASMDRNTPRTIKEPLQQESIKSMLEHRHNVYDNDEFDVFSGARPDPSRVHKGKMNYLPAITNIKNVTPDKEFIASMKPLYDLYGNEDRSSMYESLACYEETYEALQYDDEYDDTYDTNTVGAQDEDSADELTTRRPFVTPRILAGNTKQPRQEQEEEEEEEDEQDKRRRSYQNFIEDPAVLRERREESYLSRRGRGRRGGGGGGGGGQSHPPPKSRDVTGTAKPGQGQSTEVQRNRAHKDKNKAKAANHNRRAMADKKRRV